MKDKIKIYKVSIKSFLLFAIMLVSVTTYPQKMSVYFEFNKYTLSQSANDTLEKYLSILEKSDKQIQKIRISGYCDSVGSVEYNQKLSLQRAESVKKYLETKNYKVDSIVIRGVGKENPLYSNETENDRAKNRRVDVLFVTQKKLQPPPTVAVVNKQKTVTEIVKTAKIGENIQLQNMNFIPGQPYLLSSSVPAVDELIKIMKDNPKLEIQIEGHICCADDEYYPKTDDYTKLSTQRAETVYNILIKKGIDKKRISYIGYGHTRPLTQERNEEERIQNRRVEIKIIKQ